MTALISMVIWTCQNAELPSKSVRFATAQRQAFTKEAKPEHLAPQLTQEQGRMQERQAQRLPELDGVKQTHERAHAR